MYTGGYHDFHNKGCVYLFSSNTTTVTSGTGSAIPYGTNDFTPIFTMEFELLNL